MFTRESLPAHRRQTAAIQIQAAKGSTTEIFHGEIFFLSEVVRRSKPAHVEMQGSFPRGTNERVLLQLIIRLL